MAIISGTIESMATPQKTPIYQPDSHEFLGFVVKTDTSWQAQTIFGYPMTRTDTREQAEKIIQEMGLTYLTGVWQYYDKDDHDWYPCILKEAYENRVVVIRTNEQGYQDPDTYKYVVIKDPTEDNLIKSS
jgi:hypothetical protein